MIKILACAVFCFFMIAPARVRAEETAGRELTWTQQLKNIEIRLVAIEENQKKILEGQVQLSAEHQQLRYWVHRK